MQAICQTLQASEYGATSVGAEPYFVVGMPCVFTVQLVDANGQPAVPANIDNVVSWKFVFAGDFDPETAPCWTTESLTWDESTATWTIPVSGTRTAAMLAFLEDEGSKTIGCEIAGLDSTGDWSHPAYVLQWTAFMRNRRDSVGTVPDPATGEMIANVLTDGAGTELRTANGKVAIKTGGQTTEIAAGPLAAAAASGITAAKLAHIENAIRNVEPIEVNGIVKGDGAGNLSKAIPGRDFAEASHTHAQSDVTGLADALAGKAAAQHSHAQSDVSGLANALAAKASAADVTAIQAVIPSDASASNPLVTVANVPSPQLRYALVEPMLAASGTTVSATLQDRAVNAVTLASTVTAATFTFPAPVEGYARDFFLRLVIEGSTVPTITFLESGGGSLEDVFDADDDAWAEIEPGVNVLMFTETSQEAAS